VEGVYSTWPERTVQFALWWPEGSLLNVGSSGATSVGHVREDELS
jgi:hypothetical protein